MGNTISEAIAPTNPLLAPERGALRAADIAELVGTYLGLLPRDLLTQVRHLDEDPAQLTSE